MTQHAGEGQEIELNEMADEEGQETELKDIAGEEAAHRAGLEQVS
jgi:hypothetical protein